MAVFSATVVMPVTTSHLAGQAMRRALGSSTRLAFLKHDSDPMARKQLFGSLEGLVLVGSEDR